MEPQPDLGERPFLASRLAQDPDLLAEVETAYGLGVSLKRFRGWESTTHHAYDRGRLVSSTPEVEWDEQEQAWMLALKLYRDTRCPGCGGDLVKTTAAENEDRYRHELPLQCFRCVEFARAHEAYADQPHPQSFIHLVRRKPSNGKGRT